MILTISMVLTACVALAGCGGGRSAAPPPEAAVDTAAEATASISRVSIARAKPIDAYVLLGGRIKKCWFNPVAPLLPDHVYRADVSPDSSKVKITVHEKQNLGRAGASTYAIDFRQEGPSTVIVTENRKMTPELAAKMQYDIDRWKRGEPDCNKVMPPAIAAAPPPAKDAKAER